MTKLGVENAICNEAANAIGPNGQCGATPISYVSAILAILLVSEIPPAWEMSGWMISMHPASKYGRQS
jgi:hypothetical protein